MNLFLRKFFAACLILALAVIGGMQVRRAVKNARAKRLVAEAALHFNASEFREASRCLQSALKANPSSVEAAKLTADLLEAGGSPSAIIGWRIRASQLQPANMTNRLDWAQTAVKLRDAKSAEDAFSGLDEAARATVRYHKVAGALAWVQGRIDEAEQHYRQAQQLEPDNPSNTVNLDTIGLLSTNETEAAAARLSLQTVAATNGPYRLDALRRLTLEATRRKNLAEALAYTRRVVTNSAATFADKLDCLSLMTATQNHDTLSWLALLKQSATNSPADVFALGVWLAHNDGPTNTLNWLSSLPQSVQTNLPVPLIISDCQIALGHWPGLLTAVEKRNWGESETLRLVLESLARRALGQGDEAQLLSALSAGTAHYYLGLDARTHGGADGNRVRVSSRKLGGSIARRTASGLRRDAGTGATPFRTIRQESGKFANKDLAGARLFAAKDPIAHRASPGQRSL
jgi:tetratricopeptide (TPR) repeat protein